MTRLWQPRETRLLSEYVSENYPNDIAMFRVRLGPPPNWAANAAPPGVSPEIFKIYQRWADAIIITKKELILIEAKIKPDPGVISQILLYADLLPKTKELDKYKDRHIQKVILMALRDLEIENMAAKQDIKIVIYSPPWVVDYLKEIRKYRERY